MSVAQHYAKIKAKDVPGALYKIGQTVSYTHIVTAANSFTGEGVIVWVSNTGEGIEYAVDNYPWLLWEHEIKEVV